MSRYYVSNITIEYYTTLRRITTKEIPSILGNKQRKSKPSPEMIRLLALYLRGGWILAGHQKEKDEQIVFCSPKAIQTMFARLGNDAANAFKYSKDYEKIITDYKIR